MQDQAGERQDIAAIDTQRVAASSSNDISQQPTRRLTPKTKTRRRRGRAWLISLLTVALVGVLVGGTLLVINGATTSLSQTFRANATATPTLRSPSPTRAPAPGVTTARRNAAMGCAAGKPTPYPGVIINGQYPGGADPPPNEVALTFDDGPTPYSTPSILAFLEKTHTPATFFVEGQFATLWPDLVRREWNDGFAIGAHSWNHRQLTGLSAADLQQQFADTVTAIHKAIGKDMCLWLSRPPYGSAKTREIAVAASYGLETIDWDDSSGDWLRYGAANIAQTVLNQIRPGGIVLMHDGPAEREQTAEALPIILAGLKARGLTPVTIPQLLQDGHFPGVVVQPLPIAPSEPGDAAHTWEQPVNTTRR